MKKIYVDSSKPNQPQLVNLIKLFQDIKYVDAEKLALSNTEESPKQPFAWKVLGAILKQKGRISESLIVCQKTVQLDPQDAKAHNNLAIILLLQSRLEEAETSLRKAIELKPDLAEAHNNLGVILEKHRKFTEAFFAYIQAINYNPDFIDAYENLGMVLKKVRFNSSNVKVYPLLIQLLSTGNFVRPRDLAPSILTLLKHDPLIKNLLLEKNFATSLKEANFIIRSLDKLTLLHHLMLVCPIHDLQFERLFVSLRSLLLTNLDNSEASIETVSL